MSSKKRFIKYNGSRESFNNKLDRTDYNESIVFITGDPNLENVDACLYTLGSYFPNTNDFVNGLLTVQSNAKNYTDAQINSISSNYETKGAINTAIQALDADVSSTNGSKVNVLVVETDGKITGVNVTETDIASAAVLAEVKEDVDKFFKEASFAESAKDTLKELQEYINSDASLAATMLLNITDAKNTATEAKNNTDALAARVNDITLSTGTENGTVKFNNTDISVKGLNSAAYADINIFATAAQGTKADNAAPKDTVYTIELINAMFAAWEWEEI